MVSVLHNEPKYKVEKLKYKKPIINLLVKNNKREGRGGGLKERGNLLTFFP